MDLLNKNVFIFDMDGTLVDLEFLNKTSYSNTISHFYNKNISNDEYQRYFSGTKTAKAFEGYLESVNIVDYDIENLIKHFRKQKRENLVSNFSNCVSLIPGSIEYLEFLKNSSKKIALATSTIKEFVDIIIDNLNIRKYFVSIITAEDISKGKPDPEIFLLALKKCNGVIEDGVVFEDSKNGIAAAKASGMDCIGIHTKNLNDEWVKNADYVISDYRDLMK